MRLFIVCCLTGVAVGRVSSAAPTFGYIAQGERRTLTLDRSRVAIWLPEGRSVASLGALAGVSASTERGAIAGWSVVTLAAPAADPLAALNEVRDALGDEDAYTAPVFLGADGGPVIPTRDVLIRFAPGVDRAAQLAAIGASGLAVLDADWAGMENAYRLRSAARSGVEVFDQLDVVMAAAPLEFAEPDMLFTGSGGAIPTDFYFPDQWGLRNTGQSGGVVGVDVNAVPAWDVTPGSPDVGVLVIDTGVDGAHADLALAGGRDFTNDPDANDGRPVNEFDNHGTAVAGCVNASWNGVGVVGVAPAAPVYSARTFISTNANGNWSGVASWTVNAIAWAHGLGLRVTNNSNYYGFSSGAIASVYAQTREAGMVHFASAGNEASTQVSYPASLPTVNAVAAVRRNGTRASFSNFSSLIAFSAPGQTIFSTDRSGPDGYTGTDWAIVDGTSFASPMAAGVAALILSVRPTLTPDEVEWIMEDTALDLGAPGFDVETGWGLVRAFPAIEAPVPLPRAFARLLPETGATRRATEQIMFGWQPAAFTSTYDLRVVFESSGEIAFEADGLTTFAYFLEPGLLPEGRRYRWQVAARNSRGETLAASGPSDFAVRHAGDVTGDCAVTFADLNAVLSSFGLPDDAADTNADGVVDFADLNAVLSAFGRACD